MTYQILYNHNIAPKPVDPECRVDGDCPSQHACIDQRCQNPCIVRNPCSGAQKCVVTDSLPIRTVGCVCPDGSVAGPQGECVRVTATPECFRDDDCRNSEICHTGSCINACIVKDCADNAICSTTVHDIACRCRPGYTGDGHVRCSLCKYCVLNYSMCNWYI